MKTQPTLTYAGVAALIAALVQVVQVAQQLALAGVINSPGRWAISAAAGIVSAAALAALPWIKAVIPAPPAFVPSEPLPARKPPARL